MSKVYILTLDITFAPVFDELESDVFIFLFEYFEKVFGNVKYY